MKALKRWRLLEHRRLILNKAVASLLCLISIQWRGGWGVLSVVEVGHHGPEFGTNGEVRSEQCDRSLKILKNSYLFRCKGKLCMGKPAARIGDMTAHGGVITGPGCPTVLIGKMPAATMGDMHVCPMVTPGYRRFLMSGDHLSDPCHLLYLSKKTGGMCW